MAFLTISIIKTYKIICNQNVTSHKGKKSNHSIQFLTCAKFIKLYQEDILLFLKIMKISS